VRTHGAIVRWLPGAVRGRRELPATLRYVGISRFDEDGDSWPDGAWSVELRFEEPPPEQGTRESHAHVRFPVDGAPHERLREGVVFGLYEGPHKVADIEVVD
jgi:hypothetical protein